MTDELSADRARARALDHAPAGSETLAYQSPEAVLADDGLTPAQKRRFLESWLERLTGDAGGNLCGENSNAALADRLRRVMDGLDADGIASGGGSY